MKKVLVLVLVLGMVSLANAAFVLNYAPSGADYTISISTTTDITPGGGDEHYWALLTDSISLTDVGASASQTGTGFDMQLYGDISGAGLAGTGTWGTLFTTGGAISTGELFNGFLVSGTLPITVTLMEVLPDFSGYGQELASVTIIPEPITMALLGLGGLLIRRKK